MIHNFINTVLTNPGAAILIVAVAIGLSVVFKASAKIIKWIFLIGVAYIVLTFMGILA